MQVDFDRNLPNFFDGLEIGDATLSDGRRIVLFTSKKSLELLARSDCIAMDGTFKITPHPWKQVGIISAEISEECWIPIAFGLLPDKKRDTYDTFLILMMVFLRMKIFQTSNKILICQCLSLEILLPWYHHQLILIEIH